MTDEQPRFHPSGLTFVSDLSVARWIEQRLGKEFAHVGALVPRSFAGYVRLFHPAKDQCGARLTWANVAAMNGRSVHPLMAFDRIATPARGSGIGDAQWIEAPRQGSLDPGEVAALAAFLRDFTATAQRCFFAVWEGYGWFTPGASSEMSAFSLPMKAAELRLLMPPVEVLTAPRLHGVGRKYVLYSGPLSAVTSFQAHRWDSPNIWWPEDCSWCVATDIDLDSTYLGGSQACVEALLNDPRFEVLPTAADAPVYLAADTVNIGGDSDGER